MLIEIPALRGVGGVGAVSTDRQGGVSLAPFDSFNLGLHVGDDERAVQENRRRLGEAAGSSVRFAWLEQVHSPRVVRAEEVIESSEPVEADASVTSEKNVACVVMTADCLPVLFWDDARGVVGAAHAGWRGLCEGVLEATVAAMGVEPSTINAWLGPAIGPDHFEVGPEVRAAFIEEYSEAVRAFRPSPANPETRFLADLYELARQRLVNCGVGKVSGGGACTFREERFFSYRRDGKTGRMATAIFLGS